MLPTGLRERLVQRVAFGQQLPGEDPGDALFCFTGLDRLGCVQLIKAAARMGLDIAERLVLAGKIRKHPRKQRMLLNVSQISGVINVLIGKHGASSSGICCAAEEGAAAG
ncbi:hypothetical protein RA19_09385 [Leisingera sp. ANG-M1]|nr:hypothetical protein RA19_09385 [Leisingera sp. ANG-M1]